MKNIFEKNNTLLQNSLFFGTKIAKNHHNCLEYEKVLKIFLLSNFEYSQIWLNILPNDHQHLHSITKFWLKKNTLAPNKSIGERNSRNSFPRIYIFKTFALLISDSTNSQNGLKKDCHAVATLVSDSTNSQNGLKKDCHAVATLVSDSTNSQNGLKKDCHAVATLVSDSTNSQNGLLHNRWIASRES
jgi:hypothetical protein